MNHKLLFGILIVGLLVVGSFFYISNFLSQEDKQSIYQGPVRPIDDEEHFRKTGETIPMEVKS